MAGKISYPELVEKLNNPDVPISELAKYFKEAPDLSDPFVPSFEIDETKVDLSEAPIQDIATEGFFKNLIVRALNRAHTRRRQRAYEKRIRRGWPGLRLVAEGDSWFQYPLKGNDDLIDFLAKPFAVYCISAAGDELRNMLGEANRERVADVIRNTEAHGFLFSGGGNDIAGDDFVNFVRNAAPSTSIDDYVDNSFNVFLNRIMGEFRSFFDGLFAQFPELKIFLHGYDHALPAADGEWLGPSLRAMKISEEHWAAIVRIMIDRYNTKLSELAAAFPGKLMHVNCVGAIGGKREWRDELHGKTSGCRRAAQRFTAAITETWPDSMVESFAPKESTAANIKAAMEAAAAEASDPPEIDGATDRQLRESRLVPNEDLGLEDAVSELPSSLEFAVKQSKAAIPAVGWPEDRDSSDYAHLDTSPPGNQFNLKPEDLEHLIRANHFDPQDYKGLIIFGFRGASLVSAHQKESAKSVALKDMRPNHLSFRCVMGIYDRNAGRLWAYTASTVPNALSMKKYYMWQQDLGEEFLANLLPTGCYAFRRASHGWCRSKAIWKVPVALRLTTPGTANRDAIAVVLRNKNNLSYLTDSVWEKSIPHDNIRPAFSTTMFASAGCLTVRGSNERFTSRASDQWRGFQNLIVDMPKNARSDLVLLTGAEARIASGIKKAGATNKKVASNGALERLRVGSMGESVRELQQRLNRELPENLNIGVDGQFGPETQMALIRVQGKKATGIYSPAKDGSF